MDELKYDGMITLSVGGSRRTKVWKQKKVLWSELVQRLGQTTRTKETQAQFFKLPKEKQDEIKDVGGFVGGVLKGGRRTAACTDSRQLLTLDVDFAPPDFWEQIELFFGGHALCVYSTHKHTPESPRLRIVMPIKRPVTPDEYPAIGRKITEKLGIEYFDDTTYQPQRLMYWPSTSQDGEFFYRVQDGPWLDADEILAEYEDWQDQSSWPVSGRQNKRLHRELVKQQDPLTKSGLIGTFCRTYSISEAIETFLPDVYKRCAGYTDRYTYIPGSSTGGAVVYEDKWLFSHHATDPATMTLCNAFDLVRIHKFGNLDQKGVYENPKNQPSYQKMLELCANDDQVKLQLLKENQEQLKEEFSDLGEPELTEEEAMQRLAKELETSKNGKFLANYSNINLILEEDPALRGVLAWDEFAQRITVLKPPPWRKKWDRRKYWSDTDDAQLRSYMDTRYGIKNKQIIDDNILKVAGDHSFHPVRKKLDALKWDGVKRLERLFIDYLGAADTAYTRTVTRKMLIAAIGRVFSPGLKFDNVVVLEGPQGIGKSYILKLLGGEWFSDSLMTMQGKEAYEQLKGKWIIELGELAAMKKSEVEQIKVFVSKQSDSYREAYGRRVSEFPRQCIFVGTTNESVFLRDHTGNRRFWPVRCKVKKPAKSLWSDTISYEIEQVLAEAKAAWDSGEGVWIGKDMEDIARSVQRAHTEENQLVGIIEDYLDQELPESWYHLDLQTRRDYFSGSGFGIDMGRAFKRTRVCALEIWAEALNGDPKRLDAYQRKEIRNALEQIKGWKLNTSPTGQRTMLAFGKPYGRQRTYIREGTEELQGGGLEGSRLFIENIGVTSDTNL